MNTHKNPEAAQLRWLVNMFPFTENAKDETDRISNLIHLYCDAGARKIEELQDLLDMTVQTI